MNNAQPSRMYVSALSRMPSPWRARLEGGPVCPPSAWWPPRRVSGSGRRVTAEGEARLPAREGHEQVSGLAACHS